VGSPTFLTAPEPIKPDDGTDEKRDAAVDNQKRHHSRLSFANQRGKDTSTAQIPNPRSARVLAGIGYRSTPS
jgi:hypothetical protein